MAEHRAVVEWSRAGAAFTDNRYSRGHRWRFDGGVDVPASASPHVVPAPLEMVGEIAGHHLGDGHKRNDGSCGHFLHPATDNSR